MRLSDTITGCFFTVSGIAIVLHAQNFPSIPGQPYGSSFFPTLIGIAMALGGLVLASSAVIKGKVMPLVRSPDWLRSPRAIASFLLVLIAMGFYMLTADRFGFCVTTFLIIFGLQVWMKAKWLSALCIAIAAAAIFYIVFAILLRVPLPYGLVEKLLTFR